MTKETSDNILKVLICSLTDFCVQVGSEKLCRGLHRLFEVCILGIEGGVDLVQSLFEGRDRVVDCGERLHEICRV